MTTIDTSTGTAVQQRSRMETTHSTRPRARIQALVMPVLMLLVAGIVFGLQSHNIGFWSPGHGWTSVHGLALMSHATPETGFVGYSQAFVLDDGSVAYHYFDRYPPFFTAFMGLFMNITDNMMLEIMIFRHIMNVIYLLMMVVTYFTVRLWIENRWLAFAITVLSFSPFYMLLYKDMIHYDQPALLMMLVLVYTLARYHMGDWKVWTVYAAAIAAVSAGRGYSSFFVLALWFAIEAVIIFIGRDRPVAHAEGTETTEKRPNRLQRVIRHPSLWVTVIAVAWAASWLGYNMLTEARVRDMPITDTSIVNSALRRLPFVGYNAGVHERPHSSDKGIAGWLAFGEVQTERQALWFIPARFGGDMFWRFDVLNDPVEINWGRLLTGLGMYVAAIVFAVRSRPGLRVPAALLAFGGFFWLFFMINLTTKHIYVSMYGVGLTIVAYMAILGWLKRWPVSVYTMVAVSIALFALGNWQSRVYMLDEIDRATQYTRDFNRIQHAIEGNHNAIYLDFFYSQPECIIDNHICFAPGYYLRDNYLTVYEDQRDYVLSPRPFYAVPRFAEPGETVQLVQQPSHPENQVVFLMDPETSVEREMPAEPEPMFRYGDAITLQSWTLEGSVTLNACDRVFIESWWLADGAIDLNYNMQVVMVD
ncbi:MAG: hypothetical protein AAFV33_10200, partial [Chloroflexota bacterium]